MQRLLLPLERRVQILRDTDGIESYQFLTDEQASASAVITGDCRRVLGDFPSGVFQTCVTSPPYWSLRDYQIDGQNGLAATVDAYVATMVRVFREVSHVLRDDGTL